MAVQLLADHIGPAEGEAAVAQLRADHRALYRDATPAPAGDGAEWRDEFAARASTSGDPHQVKLVEACRRGFELTGAGIFVTAADTVTSGPRDRPKMLLLLPPPALSCHGPDRCGRASTSTSADVGRVPARIPGPTPRHQDLVDEQEGDQRQPVLPDPEPERA